MTGERWRCFVAVPLASELRDALATLNAESIQWTSPRRGSW